MPEDSKPQVTFNNPNMQAGHVYQSAGDQYVTNYGSPDEALAKTFAEMMNRVEQRPADAQDQLKPIVEEVHATAIKIQQGDTSPATEGALETRLRNLLEMAPDIAEVFVATITNPVAGLALTFKKIVDRAKGVTPAGGTG